MSLLQHEGGRSRARRLASRLRAFGAHALCTSLATLLVWLPLQAYAPARARAQDIPQISDRAIEQANQAEVEASPIDRETLETRIEGLEQPIDRERAGSRLTGIARRTANAPTASRDTERSAGGTTAEPT